MNCPVCSDEKTFVKDTRQVSGAVRRRRICLKCEYRFTTDEKIRESYSNYLEKENEKDFEKSNQTR